MRGWLPFASLVAIHWSGASFSHGTVDCGGLLLHKEEIGGCWEEAKKEEAEEGVREGREMSREKALALSLGTTLARVKQYPVCVVHTEGTEESLWLGAISLGGQGKYLSVWATITNYHVPCDLQITKVIPGSSRSGAGMVKF